MVDSILCLSLGSASAGHLPKTLKHSVRETLSQKISQIVSIPFERAKNFSLEGNTLTVLEKSGHSISILLNDEQAKKVGKAIARAIGFIRNTGDFEYGSAHRKEAVFSLLPPPDSFRTAAKAFVLGPLDKGMALCRDAMVACSLRSGGGIIARSLGGAVGVIELASGIFEIVESGEAMAEADRVSDREGYERAEAHLVQSQMEVAAGTTFIAQSVWAFAAPGMGSLAAAVCAPLFMLFMSIGSVIGAALPIMGIQRCTTFLDELNEYLENPDLTEEQRVSGALRFLQEMTSLSPEEEGALGGSKEAGALLENKLRHAKRRTSLQSLVLIANTSEELLRQIADPATRAGGIEQARTLIRQVKKASYSKIALNACVLFAIAVGFSAILAAFILTGGSLPLLLALGAGAFCLVLSLYCWIAREFYRLSKDRVDPQLIQN